MVQSSLAGLHCKPPEQVTEVWWAAIAVALSSAAGSNHSGIVICRAQARRVQQLASAAPAHGSLPNSGWRAARCKLDTAVLDGMFPVRLSLPTHISPFLTLILTTGTLSSSQLLTGINTVALIS